MEDGQENQGPKINDDTEIFEHLIFSLSPILGGRTEVLKTPLNEAIKYYQLHTIQKKINLMDSFMTNFFGNPMSDAEDRAKYLDSITVRHDIEYKTDLNQLEMLKKRQESG